MRVLLVDDHKIVRDGLRTMLEKESYIEAVAEAHDGLDAIERVRLFAPDVVLMDISMPNLNGMEATKLILTEHKEIKVIALSMHSDKWYVKEMFKAGAFGFLLKECAYEELLVAVKIVASKRYYMSPSITGTVVTDYIKKVRENTSVIEVLTPREREVLQQLAEGKTTNVMALEFHLSEKTIETHRRNIMNKLGLYSVAELTKYAIREGLTSSEL